MGGAERNARKRKRNQGGGAGPGGATSGAKAAGGKAGGGKPAARPGSAQAALAAARAGKNDRTKVILGVVAVVVVAAAVIGGVIWTNNKKNATADAAIPVAAARQELPTRREDAAVLVGEDSAKVTLDVYEDFLCPACRGFEAQFGPAIEQKMDEGVLKVRFHLVNLLNSRSDPEGYSTDSANAALLAADEGKFLRFHKSLYDSQPEEGARGWSKDQLIELGRAVGITGQAFADGVRAGKYDQQVTAAYEKARNTESLLQDAGNGQKAFGTPTLAVGDRVVDTSQADWLERLVTG
ncbi:DsbA family protein [Actinokineospora sp. PR83]|uniref:DsbA family protein n=1 Tax=Actinokineospora sp. PR83 TaxID=2884908 RepID=UPI0027DEF7C4|nr:thioredoxin domain-containing protein [Actinokineospora sp. PR83]MCG8914928.1 DsbA family protein [Actinokineospora sp. PR83]